MENGQRPPHKGIDSLNQLFLSIIEQFLPAQIKESEIKDLAQQTIDEVGAESVKDLGKVMPILMKKLAGKAEGKIVNKVVTELLS